MRALKFNNSDQCQARMIQPSFSHWLLYMFSYFSGTSMPGFELTRTSSSERNVNVSWINLPRHFLSYWLYASLHVYVFILRFCKLIPVMVALRGPGQVDLHGLPDSCIINKHLLRKPTDCLSPHYLQYSKYM